MKKIRVFAFVLLFVVSLSVPPAHAAANIEHLENSAARYTNISYFSNNLTINSLGKATVDSTLLARYCDEVSINVYLQQYSGGTWTTIKSWSTYQYGATVTLNQSWYVASGYQYRMVSYGYVYSGGELLESTSNIGASQNY